MIPSSDKRIPQNGKWITSLTAPLSLRWTLGSALFLASFAAVIGPLAYVKHLLSGSRLPFTAAYFGSIGMTMYFSIGVSVTRCLASSLVAPLLKLRY